MMNVVKIEPGYININFMKKIITLDSDYLIDIDTLNFLEDIDRSNINLIHYIVYRILNENTLIPNINLKPKNGLEFINKINKKDGLGIYHAHLNNEMVLSWYIEYIDNEYYLKLIYDKHPDSNDSYKKMLTSIYKNPYSYNIFTSRYMKDDINKTMFNENKYIFTFKNFLYNYKK